VSKPRLLDLFCGAGGAAMGYHRAGFEVVGVDIKPQPQYPFEFHQGDAMDVLHRAAEYTRVALDDFEAIHASPPCQYFTQMRASWRAQGYNDGYVDLLTPTLAVLRDFGVPYVVENVIGAKRAMRPDVILHGGMFGLTCHRPRAFECSFFSLSPVAPVNREPIGVYDTRPRGMTHHRTRKDRNGKRSEMRIARTVAEAQEALGIDWTDEWLELKEAIPPAYTEWLGTQLLQAIKAAA
jgi:DNA (cytosine-5)-methyltransferase 1